MKTYEVTLLAFGNGEVRPVTIDYDGDDTQRTLSEVFKFGQNDFQPLPFPSVSAGDIIRIGEDRFLICMIGFEKLSLIKYDNYVQTPRRDRDLIYNCTKG